MAEDDRLFERVSIANNMHQGLSRISSKDSSRSGAGAVKNSHIREQVTQATAAEGRAYASSVQPAESRSRRGQTPEQLQQLVDSSTEENTAQ